MPAVPHESQFRNLVLCKETGKQDNMPQGNKLILMD